ncbi:family 2A encapsulin nanocompartment cargo protein cysteine desulfurase [Undibacterium terreum]|uniref:cysteine desulfurase n=1 Tax=Undibacterium terreum TaxID=1224302 RepID=A0A916UI16_9BURK|nr:family 2A encapsulin nanocompartment cargo protein cysteine desulfurase [Undibacterium terreum]GGC74306.1 hypothetical protein GCM10011396_21870 [Undibacterium terreum]
MSTSDLGAALPDIEQLARLANQYFSELPGGGSGAAASLASPASRAVPPASSLGGLPASAPAIADAGSAKQQPHLGASPGSFSAQGGAVPPLFPLAANNLTANTSVLSKPASQHGYLAGIVPQGYGLPTDADLRQLLVPRSPSAGRAALPVQASQTNTAHGAAPDFYFLQATRLYEPGLRQPGLHTDALQQQGITRAPFDINLVRRDFPILQEKVEGRQLVWLDNAATTQKPQSVIDRVSYFYAHENSNIHRAAHTLAARATDAYEGAREKVRAFLNAASVNEIVFVRGTTEAINLVAQSWGRQHIRKDDEIIISWLEHHANIVPWQQLCAEKGAKLKLIPVDDDGQIILEEYAKLLTPRTRLVSVTQVSNALGTITPAKKIAEMAHSVGAKVLIDGAQSVSHLRADVQDLDADWFVFSGHKVFGPTGIGVLYGKEALLNETQPWQGGGNMIKDVTFEHTEYHAAPGRFEAGTGNIADAVGLGAAIDYVNKIGIDNINWYEHQLLGYATNLLKQIPGLHLIGTAADKASVLSFVLDGFKTEQVGAALSRAGIAVRSGHHCAQPILRRFGQESTVRPSLAFYNNCADVDALVTTVSRLKSGKREFY